MLTVNEIFLSINGETSSVGLPTTFIRLAGCNLSCWGGCDTVYAIPADAGTAMTVGEIIGSVKGFNCHRICLTGGEPLLDEENSIDLLQTLIKEGYSNISIETNGSVDLHKFKKIFDSRIRFIMDIKPPSSGMSDKMQIDNLKILSESDEVKFVVADHRDFNWWQKLLQSHKTEARILFSPLFGVLDPSVLVDWVIGAKMWDCRLQLQIHKYIWSPDKRGV